MGDFGNLLEEMKKTALPIIGEYPTKKIFFEKGLDPIYLVHPGFYRKHPGEDKKYNKLHSIQTPGV